MDFLHGFTVALKMGSIGMYAILVFQVAAIVIITEKVMALYVRRKGGQMAIANQFEELIRRGDLKEVMVKASSLSHQHPIARAILAGAQAAQNFGGKDEIQGKMDEVLLHENAFLEKKTGYLPVLANVAMLAGLLGTISGMITSFSAVSQADQLEKAAKLSSGISEAMYATAYGLTIAITCLVLYAMFSSRTKILTEDLNQSALRVFNWLSFAYDPVSKKA